MKNNKWSQKGLKNDDVALNGAFWTHKKSGVQISWKNEIPLKQMSFRPKPWYFERDCLFCTRSASRFCLNPLYFVPHAMLVKWWYHDNFQHFQSSFEMLLNELRKGWKLAWYHHFIHIACARKLRGSRQKVDALRVQNGQSLSMYQDFIRKLVCYKGISFF